MTEKRYLNIIPTGHIIDTKTDTILRGSGISDLLNNQDEQIKELENELAIYKITVALYDNGDEE